jgi:phosphoribosylglycinamide formyltransferase-1
VRELDQLRLGFLSSHGGSNMQAIFDARKAGRLDAAMCVVISNNSRSAALRRAKREQVPFYHLSERTHPGPEKLDGAILQTFEKHDVNLVVLAGYMKLLGPKTLYRYRGRVLNVHPALLPKFGGKGFYGRAVHEAVLAAGESVTGVTIHLVDQWFDHGPIVAQTEVSVLDRDTPDSLGERVLRREHQFYSETLRRIQQGEIDLDRLSGGGE